jgi:hypothetical protein
MNRSKQVGTATETAVVRYLRDNGWPGAERRALRGHLDAGDLTGTPGLCWSVKGGDYARYPSDGQITEWLNELDRQRKHAGADHGILVTRRYRVGDPGRWWAWARTSTVATLTGGTWPADDSWMVTHLEQAARIIRVAGYGNDVTL